MRHTAASLAGLFLPALLPAQDAVAAAGSAPFAVDTAALAGAVGELERASPGLELSVWTGGARGDAAFAHAADVWRPAASAIKTAYLVEWFATVDDLDEPLGPAARTVVGDPQHPAVVHFSPAVQSDVRRVLGSATPRRIAFAMIRGAKVSNPVYNAAANLVTAHLGGPRALTARLRARWPTAGELAVRRYMLAARDVTGDNELQAAALARVLQALARRDVPGVPGGRVDAMREVMFLEQDARLGAHYFKSGALDSTPPVRLRTGWYERDGRALVYVVITAQAPTAQAPVDPEALARTAVAMTRRVLEHAAPPALGVR